MHRLQISDEKVLINLQKTRFTNAHYTQIKKKTAHANHVLNKPYCHHACAQIIKSDFLESLKSKTFFSEFKIFNFFHFNLAHALKYYDT